MKFSHFLSFAASACLSIGIALAAPLHGDYESTLQARNTPPLTLHLSKPTTFYRAITGKEMAHVATNYKAGHHPAKPLAVPGDFSPNGAVYVFADLAQAIKWGDAFAVTPISTDRSWYLVTFKYTPKAGMKIKSFPSGTADWKAFVEGNYKAGAQSSYDIVEGPVSVGNGARLQPYLDGTHMVYQAAFMNKGLETITVESVVKKSAPANAKKWCDGCHLM